MYYLKLYLCTLLVFLVIDMVWLGLLAREFYQKHLGVPERLVQSQEDPAEIRSRRQAR